MKILSIYGLLFILVFANSISQADDFETGRIQPGSAHPRYWQYHCKPVLLLGGTKDDNLFQIADVEEHLDLLVSVGGNYIRCVMSGRDEGNVWPFAQDDDGQYDLTRFNAEYWNRFDRLLKLTHERQIIVQIEVWAFHDFFDQYGTWGANPWHPANNVNYTPELSRLKKAYSTANNVHHDFFFTVPKLNDNQIMLEYQQRFADRLLESTLRYDHVLYCMTNEIHPLYPPEWGWYWADHIRRQASEEGKRVETSEMYWQTDLKHSRHRQSIDHPETYTFFEASQNSALKGQQSWENLQHVWHALAEHPRPINHTKIYGANTGRGWEGSDDNATARFWRNIIGGSASSRFHRPSSGLGLSAVAQTHIRSMRMLTSELDLVRCVPDSESLLLSDREPDEAYLTRVDGRQYAVYFPNGGSARLDLSAAQGSFTLKWLDVANSRWEEPQTIEAGQRVVLTSPGKGHWGAFLLRRKPGALH